MAYEGKKQGVWDTRLSPPEPCYAVRHGANQVSAQQFAALTANATQHVYNVQVPSLQTFVDRNVKWQSTVQFGFCFSRGTVIAATTSYNSLQAASNAGFGPPVQGQDFAPRSYPLQSLTTSMLLSVNDTSTTLNTAQCYAPLVRLIDSEKGRRWDTTPCRNDVFLQACDGYGSPANPYADATAAENFADPPNGAFPHTFVIPSTNSSLGGWTITTGGGSTPTGGYTATNGNVVVQMSVTNGIFWPSTITLSSGGPYFIAIPYAIQYTFLESLMVAPMSSGETNAVLETAMFGINNFQLTAQLQGPDSARVFRQLTAGAPFGVYSTLSTMSTTGVPIGISSLGYNNIGSGTTPFQNSQLLLNFLTAPLTMHLPDKSIVPYTDLVVYSGLAQSQVKIQPGSSATITTNNVTLSSVPDYLVISVTPQTTPYQTATTIGAGAATLCTCTISTNTTGGGFSAATTAPAAATATLPYLPAGTQTFTIPTTAANAAFTAPNAIQPGTWMAVTTALAGGASGLTLSIPCQVLWSTVTATPAAGQVVYFYNPLGVSGTPTAGVLTFYSASAVTSTPSAFIDYTYGEWFAPVLKVNATFDNASGLLSSVSQSQLYHMSRENGLDMPWLQWSNGTGNTTGNGGSGQSGVAIVPYQAQIANSLYPGQTTGMPTSPNKYNQNLVQLSGGPMVLSMGKDIQLYETLAPGVAGNFSVSFQLTAFNPLTTSQCAQYGGDSNGIYFNISVVAVNSGFFTSIGGQSSRTVTPLIQADVAASNGEHKANGGQVLTTGEVKRMVGGGSGWHDMVSSGLSRIGHMFRQHAPALVDAAASAIKHHVGSKRGRGTPQGYDGIEQRLS